MKRIKATTIMELIIVMLITSIFVSIFFFSYLKISGSFKSMQKKSEYIENVNFFFNIIKKDFEYANEITFKENTLTLSFNTENQRIYTLNTKNIIINTLGVKDTFNFDSVAYTAISLTNYPNLIKDFQVQLYNDNNQNQVFLTKQYPSKTLINYELNQNQ